MGTVMLETQIDQWRSYLHRRQAIVAVDIAELEDHLREQITALTDSGLDEDEAFLVAVKRIGNLDALSREFAREHSERLWKQLVIASTGPDEVSAWPRDAMVAFALAVAAALAVKLPALFGLPFGADETAGFYARNAAFFVVPLLAGYFIWQRALPPGAYWRLGAVFVAAAVVVNAYPFARGGHTQTLAILHLPFALWLVLGIAYAGERWRTVAGRMDFLRFSGELFIYYVLIALGGGVLTGFTALFFTAIGVDVETFIQSWLLPCGAAGAVIVAAWLVEAKQSVIENMAPVLTRLFTPLFAAMLVAFLVALIVTGHGIDIERDILIAADLLLVVVAGLLLYSISARDPWSLPGLNDYAQIVLLVSALLVDAVTLWAIAGRIAEFGVSPNRIAALGLNLVLLGNLAVSTVLYARFVRGDGLFATLERWQTGYLKVYFAWTAFVVVAFPPLFAFA